MDQGNMKIVKPVREKGAGAQGQSQGRPTETQKKWLRRGLTQPGGKLPLFDEQGKQISTRTVKSCIHQGWAEPWFENPVKPDWLVCKLTAMGREIAVT